MPKLPPRESWDSLPEVGIGRREKVINGKTVWAPFMEAYEEVWFEEVQPPGWYDVEGYRWRFVKTPDGKWAKTRWY